jgi:hypothetical protein
MKMSAWLAAIAPDTVSAVGRRLGSADVADELAERQRPKR